MIRSWLTKRRLQKRLNDMHPVAVAVRDQKLTYLSRFKLLNIQDACETVLHESVPGDFLECGVALGGSAIFLAKIATEDAQTSRCFAGYDVFGMIPAPGELDDERSHARYEVIKSGQSKGIDGQGEYYGYIEDLYQVVVKNFEGFGLGVDGQSIALHQGLFEDSLLLGEGQKVALAHIDCDWHDPVELCLARIYPHLSPGGFIILDDYNDYGGCRLAVDEFLARVSDIERLDDEHNLVLRRRG